MTESEHGQTSAPLIPKDWQIKTLAQLSIDVGDGIHATPKYVESSEFHFINGNNLSNGSIQISNTTMSVSEDEYKKYRKTLGSQTILMSINGTIGNLAYYKNEQVVLGKSAAYINLDKSVCKEYVFYFLQTTNINNYFENELTGTTIRNLSLTSLRNTPIFLPPTKEEQTAISRVLSDTDALIDALDRLVEKKRLIKQAAMQTLLTGKKRLPGYGNDFQQKKLREIATIYRGASPRPIENPKWFDDSSSVGWVRISDVTKSSKYLLNTTQRLSKEGIKNSRFVAPNKLITSICATVGRPIITKIKVCIHDGFVVFENLQAEAEYLYYVLSYIEDDWSRQGQTGSQMNLNTTIIGNATISLPETKEEQKSIARVLSAMDLEIEALEQERDKCKLLKAGLMQQLLTGRIRLKWKS